MCVCLDMCGCGSGCLYSPYNLLPRTPPVFECVCVSLSVSVYVCVSVSASVSVSLSVHVHVSVCMCVFA